MSRGGEGAGRMKRGELEGVDINSQGRSRISEQSGFRAHVSLPVAFSERVMGRCSMLRHPAGVLRTADRAVHQVL